MKPTTVSFFRLPALWLFMGPPAFRQENERNALDSLEGHQDIWNMLRLAWWLFWGTMAIIDLIRYRVELKQYLRQVGTFPILAGLWLIVLYASCLVSPTPVFSLAEATMIALLVISATQLSLMLYRQSVTADRLLRLMLGISIVLLTIVGIHFLTVPNSSTGAYTFGGVRIRGTGVAYTPLLSLVAFFSGTHFLLNGNRHRLFYAAAALYGLWWLYLGQTRSAYAGFFIGAAILIWRRWNLGRDMVRLFVAIMMGAGIVASALFLYGTSNRATAKLDGLYVRFVLRDYWAVKNEEVRSRNFATMNGRTEAASVLLKGAGLKPLGLGYVAGPRMYMHSAAAQAELGTVSLANAHNAYLEMYAGSGPLAILLWFLLIGGVAARARVLGKVRTMVFIILLICVLFEGMFETDLVWPFKQSSGLFWIVAAVICALRVQYDHMARRILAGYPTYRNGQFSTQPVNSYGQ